MSSEDDEETVVRSQLLVKGRNSTKVSLESGEEHRLRARRDEDEVDFNTGMYSYDTVTARFYREWPAMPVYGLTIPVGLLNATEKGPNSRAQRGSAAL